MAEPLTGGSLRTEISDMQVGDYIIVGYTTSTTQTPVGHFFSVGRSTNTEMPTTGIDTSNGSFYFIMVEKTENGGLLIADRVVRHSVSWDSLNSAGYIQGRETPNDGTSLDFRVPGIIRSLGGGNSYADANGNSSTTDQGLGAFPVDNEWDEYIVRKDYGTGAGRDDVWHFSTNPAWCQETPIPNITSYDGMTRTGSNQRMRRGYENAKAVLGVESNFTSASTGFRPVFQYMEVSP